MAEIAGVDFYMPAEIANLAEAAGVVTKAAKATVAGLAGATGIAASPAAIIKGAQVVVAAHSLAVLGFVGCALLLLGLSDSVRQRRENQQAMANPDPQPENIW
jgi:ABC-type Na+ efflux pump permease subunit